MRDRLNGGTGWSLNTNEHSAPGKSPARLLEFLDLIQTRFRPWLWFRYVRGGLNVVPRALRVLYFSNWYKRGGNSLNLLVR
jgi:hypothetical protein